MKTQTDQAYKSSDVTSTGDKKRSQVQDLAFLVFQANR
jgi:hypothetical protein